MITQDDVTELLRYQKSTGKFFWRARAVKWFKGSASRTPEHTMKIWNARYAGNRADLLNKSAGDRRITIQYATHQASRLAFLYVTGVMPEEAGHKNKRLSDNRWVNLIASCVRENRKNRVQRRGSSGLCGVAYHKNTKSWQAKITINSVSKSLGYSKSFFESCCRRKSAENKFGYGNHFN